MKKHKNILSEVTHIKHLMGLREYSHDDCEDQLENAGYIVYNPTEQRTSDAGCQNNEKMKCVKNVLINELGVDASEINIKKHSNGNCYLMHKSATKNTLDGETYDKVVWVFWSNGRLATITSFSIIQNDVNHSKSYVQFQYDGKYECSGSTLKWKDLIYSGMYDKNNRSNLITSFPGATWKIRKLDGSGNEIVSNKEVGRLYSKNHTFNSSHFNY